MKRIVLLFAAMGAMAMVSLSVGQAGAQTNAPDSSGPLPATLDIKRFVRERFTPSDPKTVAFKDLVGIQHYDGLPFQIDGRGWLYGSREAESVSQGQWNYPDFMGVVVGRRFEELHLLHACRWQEGEGQAIAIVRLNYSDGTSRDIEIKYGVQVRDWQRMPSEEREAMSDPRTRIVWRGVPANRALKSTVRLFKTRLDNPAPEKMVATIDFVSTKKMAAYDLVAATVANHDPKRSVTPPVEPPNSEKEFSRTTTIRVLDENGNPMGGVLLDPGIQVDKAYIIALPQYTATNGEGVIRYPGMRTTSLTVRIEKAGYEPQYLSWGAKKYGDAAWQHALEYVSLMKSFVPPTNVVRLVPKNSSRLPPAFPR